MARQKLQRVVASTILLVLTVFWLAVWLFGWFVAEDEGLAEQGFFTFWIFLAATLVYYAVRASIYE